MDEKEFFDFAYEEYKTELAVAYSLHQRAGILLTAVVIIGGAAASIARIDLIGQTSQRGILMLHVASLSVGVCLVASVAFLFWTALPRDYPKLGKAFFWHQWRKRYKATLVEDDPEDDERNQAALTEATLEAILEMVTDAQTAAAWMNQKRLLAFHRGICCLGLAVIALGLEGLFALLLKMNGV